LKNFYGIFSQVFFFYHFRLIPICILYCKDIDLILKYLVFFEMLQKNYIKNKNFFFNAYGQVSQKIKKIILDFHTTKKITENI
jgi:hypothetical protein